VPKEPSTPFDRLRHCIRYNPLNSRDRKTQHLIFQLSEGFRGFISAALGQTYRFQIFLTSSIVPIGESRDRFPVGVWQVVRWMVNQLEPVYRAQSDLQLDHDRAALEQLRRDISGALLRDKEAYADFELAAKLKEERVAAKMQLRLVDKVLARDPETTEKRMESAKKRMAVALEEAFGLADFKPISAAADPAPFTIRRRMAYAARARLEEQIVYLTEWRERLFSKAPSISIATDKNRKAQASFPRVVSPISRAS
jgi:hypothetical protein